MSKKQYDSARIALICFALMAILILGITIKNVLEPKPDLVKDYVPAQTESVEETTEPES